MRTSIFIAGIILLTGCGGPTLAGEWKSDQQVPGLALQLSGDGTYTGTLYRSGAQSEAIAGNYSLEGDMLKLNMADARGASPGRQLIGTVAPDKRTLTLEGYGVLRKQ